MKTTVSSKGQIVLPAELREQDHIAPGQQFSIERLNRGEYRLRRIRTPQREGLIEWLTSCPELDWFQPIPSTQSTDAI